MTLSGIMKLALRQLDEAAEDISEYDEVFRCYANMGYMIAQRLFYKPRETYEVECDGEGRASIAGLPIARIVEARNARGEGVRFSLSGDGSAIQTMERYAALTLLCETEKPPMQEDTEEPQLPEYVHPALADYICYRHLSSGSLAKQSRADFFKQSFYQQMRAIRPQGAGSVTRMRGLYEAT